MPKKALGSTLAATFVAMGICGAPDRAAAQATYPVALYPQVPTLKELGLDIVELAEFGLMGPKGLPPEVVAKVRAALVAELQKPEIKQFLDGLGIVPVGSTPEEFGRKLAALTAHWAELAPKLGLEKQ